jgi:hypothetical protein
MNKNQANKILRQVNAGQTVSFNQLRSAASAIGISTKAGVKKDELITGLKGHIAKVGVSRGPGRPKADPTKIVGYKVKIGLRYPTEDGSLTTNMKEAKTFDTVEAGQAVVDNLVKSGEVRVWGGSVRAKFLPRYGSSK